MITARQWAATVAKRCASPTVALSDDLPLAEFQAHAAARLTAMIREWGGALLADAVGLGKTRVAITVAVAMARDQRIAGASGAVWLCVPSRLKTSWAAAAHAGGLDEFELVTHAAMSRGRVPETPPLFIVVDEAHRFRNLGTARRHTLAEHATSPMLLVTATPVANSLDDLWNVLELFLDDEDVRCSFGWDLTTARRLASEQRWDPVELVREVTVRRTEPPETSSFGTRPRVALRVVSYEPTDDEAWLWANLESQARSLSLFRDGDDWPLGLFVEHVLRRWESGPDALLETLRELLSYAERSARALQSGRTLDRRAFRDLFGAQPRQEVFGFLYPDEGDGAPPELADLNADIVRLQELIARAGNVCRGARGRDEAIVNLAQSTSSLLVFTSYRSAARGIYDRLVRALGSHVGVGLITGEEARATGLGRAPSAELLRRFSPRSHGATMRSHQRLDVLVATDCIAEGVNLQDCGHIVLADLPYSPLRVEQRIGRLLRPGGEHEVVQAYLCRPKNWNDSLGMRRRLQSKLQAARDVGFADADSGPFAALTSLERIATRVDDDLSLPPAMTLAEHPTAWLVLARVGDRPWFFVHGDAHNFVAELSELVWDERELTRCEIPASIVERLRDRAAFLRAANEAPTSLGFDDPEALAWRLLVDESSRIGLQAEDVESLRPRLLRRHRLGVRERLRQLGEVGSARRMLRFVQSLPAPRGQPEVELVAALGLAGQSST